MPPENPVYFPEKLVATRPGYEFAFDIKSGILDVNRARELKMKYLGDNSPIVSEIMQRFCLSTESPEFHHYQLNINRLREVYTNYLSMPDKTRENQDEARQYLFTQYNNFYFENPLLPLAQSLVQNEISERFGVDLPPENELVRTIAQITSSQFNPGQSPDPAEQVVLDIRATGMTFWAFAVYHLLEQIDAATKFNRPLSDELEKIKTAWLTTPDQEKNGIMENPHTRDYRILTVIMRSDHEVRQ